jgi:hypothetical protein
MRVRHSEVVVWEDNPAAWVASKLTTAFFPPWTYDGMLRLGLHRFHRTRDSVTAGSSGISRCPRNCLRLFKSRCVSAVSRHQLTLCAKRS